jgi:hypothetical protein
MKTHVEPCVFIAAAAMVDAGHTNHCCPAIMDAGDQGRFGPESRFFEEWFRPEGVSADKRWFGDPWLQLNQQARVLALLLAAVLAEEEFS